MFVAWMTTVSIGVLIARFFRSVWSKAFFFGEAFWFQVGTEEENMKQKPENKQCSFHIQHYNVNCAGFVLYSYWV